MQRILFDYSLKNIGVPSQDVYRTRLIQKVENIVSRMRWKAYFFLNGSSGNQEYKYGLKSKKTPPTIKDMKSFKNDLLIDMIQNVEFRKLTDDRVPEQDKSRPEKY